MRVSQTDFTQIVKDSGLFQAFTPGMFRESWVNMYKDLRTLDPWTYTFTVETRRKVGFQIMARACPTVNLLITPVLAPYYLQEDTGRLVITRMSLGVSSSVFGISGSVAAEHPDGQLRTPTIDRFERYYGLTGPRVIPPTEELKTIVSYFLTESLGTSMHDILNQVLGIK